MISKKRFYGKKSEQYCDKPEEIENYDKAVQDVKLWNCHHRLETHFSDGTPRPDNAFLRREELEALGMYFNRPADEFIFLTPSEHRKLHVFDKQARQSISESLTGRVLSDETKEKIRQYNLGKKLSPEVIEHLSNRMMGNTNTLGKRWFNNGVVSVMRFECPDGFVPGRIYGKRA